MGMSLALGGEPQGGRAVPHSSIAVHFNVAAAAEQQRDLVAIPRSRRPHQWGRHPGFADVRRPLQRIDVRPPIEERLHDLDRAVVPRREDQGGASVLVPGVDLRAAAQQELDLREVADGVHQGRAAASLPALTAAPFSPAGP